MWKVLVYFDPIILTETGLIDKDKFTTQTLVFNAIPLLQPSNIDSQGTINLVITNKKTCEECRYFADSNDLAKYLASFMSGLKKYDVQERVCFCLHSGDHFVGIGFDTQKNEFVLIGPNSLPIVSFKNPYDIAKLIAEEFGQKNTPARPIIINFKTYAITNDDNNVNLSKRIADAFYQKHEIEDERYKIPYAACNKINLHEEGKWFDKRNGQSLLDLAAQSGQYALVEKIITECKNPGPELLLNRYTNDSPLHFSILFQLPEITKLLLKHQADPNSQGINKQTPLHLAVLRQYTEIAKLLLDNKADPDKQDAKGQTALHYAAYKQNPTLIKMLLSYGADPDIRDITNRTPLGYADTQETFSLLETANKRRDTNPTSSINKQSLFKNKDITSSNSDEDNTLGKTKKI